MSTDRSNHEPERRPRTDPVRWQVQRERLRLEQAWPGRPRRCIASLQDVLDGTMQEISRTLGTDPARPDRDLEADWESYVGNFYGAHTRPGAWQAGVLTVYVDHPVYMNELVRFGKKKFLADLQQALGADRIRDVVFRPDPGRSNR